MYFITICVLDRAHSFGSVVDGQVLLSAIGEAAVQCWREIPQHYSMVWLDQWVVMPDHFHGILIIKPNENDLLQYQQDETPAGLRPLRPASVSAIINQFKGAVKRWCNQNDYAHFAWQPRYHDHIVRNVEALGKIRE